MPLKCTSRIKTPHRSSSPPSGIDHSSRVDTDCCRMLGVLFRRSVATLDGGRAHISDDLARESTTTSLGGRLSATPISSAAALRLEVDVGRPRRRNTFRSQSFALMSGAGQVDGVESGRFHAGSYERLR